MGTKLVYKTKFILKPYFNQFLKSFYSNWTTKRTQDRKKMILRYVTLKGRNWGIAPSSMAHIKDLCQPLTTSESSSLGILHLAPKDYSSPDCWESLISWAWNVSHSALSLKNYFVARIVYYFLNLIKFSLSC